MDVLGYVLTDDLSPLFKQASARSVVFPSLVAEELSERVGGWIASSCSYRTASSAPSCSSGEFPRMFEDDTHWTGPLKRTGRSAEIRLLAVRGVGIIGRHASSPVW